MGLFMKLKRNIIILFSLWTLIIGFSLTMSYIQVRDAVRESATTAARSLFTKDVLYRQWNAQYGGVYVPITESTQPNPYLTQIKKRDIKTRSGNRLTLINPAYMTRQVHELGLSNKGFSSDITSLNPIRPSNSPTSWQKQALEQFEKGTKEYTAVKDIDGKRYMRFMRPLMTKKSCLKCHAQQGYKVGDVRGGISISLPMDPYFSGMRTQMTFLGLIYGVIWFLGLSGLGVGYMFNKRQIIERWKAEEEYKQVFNGTQDAMFLIRVEDVKSFRFIRNNETHQETTGITPEAIRDKTPQQLLGEEQGKKVVQNYINCVNTGRPISYEEDLELPGGKKTWSTTLTPVFKNNKIQYIVGSSQDITERKHVEERLRYLATTDELTGMWNRRYFTQATKNELERAHRYQQIFSLLMLDIDHFKMINDTYGHGAGDGVLRHIANLIRKNLRQVDIPGRFGGEEFAIILPHSDPDAAYATAERLRQYIENTPAVYKNIEIPFRVSIGIATYQGDIKNEDEIYKRADDALYEAKRKGRNMTLIYNKDFLK